MSARIMVDMICDFAPGRTHTMKRENWNFIKFPALDWQNSRDAENAVCESDKFNIEQFTETFICCFFGGREGRYLSTE